MIPVPAMSAIERLLAQMQAQRQGMQGPPEPPKVPQEGLMGTKPADPVHEHTQGIRGGLMHAIGADQMAPELAGLLTPEQRERAMPGLLRSVAGAVFEGKSPGAIQQERGANMLALTDLRRTREKAVRDERAWGDVRGATAGIADPQERLEATARLSAEAGLPQGELTSQAAQRLRPDATGTAGHRMTERPYMGGQARFRDGIWDAWVVRPPGGGDDDLAFQRMAARAAPLGTSFQRETERHQVVAESLTTMDGLREAALAGDGPAQHMLVFSMMKLADPGSAVRQDERADTRNAANVPERLRAAWNQLLEGGGNMSEHTIRQFLSTADSTRAARIRDFDSIRRTFITRSGILKVDPELVVLDYFEHLRNGPPGSAPAPAVVPPGQPQPPTPAPAPSAARRPPGFRP